MASGLVRRLFSYSKYLRIKQLQKINNLLDGIKIRNISTSSKLGTAADTKSQDENDAQEPESSVRYPGHIPTNMFQKTLLTVGSAAMSLYDPARGDMIATLGDVTAHKALLYIKGKMEADPVGRQILEEKPIITSETVSIDYLGSLPDNTFGKEYWRFLSVHGFSPDARLPVHFVDEPDLVYVMLRYRQVHDLFHSVLGMKPNILGEVAVKWVEAIQTGLPMCALGAVFGPLRLGPVHRQKYANTYLSWAIQNARQGKFLMSVYFEKHWEQDLAEFRKELNLIPPPEIPYPEKKSKETKTD